MTNIEKYNQIFGEVFGVDISKLGAGFNSQNVDGWDSVRQLSLTASMEDIIDFNSYENGKAILAKYEIVI